MEKPNTIFIIIVSFLFFLPFPRFSFHQISSKKKINNIGFLSSLSSSWINNTHLQKMQKWFSTDTKSMAQNPYLTYGTTGGAQGKSQLFFTLLYLLYCCLLAIPHFNWRNNNMEKASIPWTLIKYQIRMKSNGIINSLFFTFISDVIIFHLIQKKNPRNHWNRL